MDAELLSILACPKCKGSLELLTHENDQGLACVQCTVVYPILDTIPVLLTESGITRELWNVEGNAQAREAAEK